LLRKLETGDWAFWKLCCIKYKISFSLYPEHVFRKWYQNHSCPVKSKQCIWEKLKSPKILITYVKNLRFALAHSEKAALHLSAYFVWVHNKFVQMHVIFVFATPNTDLNWETQQVFLSSLHVYYWLLRYQQLHLRHREIWILP
jgi:hypothetical protein